MLTLAGIILFIGACLGILLVNAIEQFIAMRFLQGFDPCFIGTVDYPPPFRNLYGCDLHQNHRINGRCHSDCPLTRLLAGSVIVAYFTPGK
ncbi:hypothetical protein [Sodalis-like endosymbiont of Proechinophthirus fluctus]|uniref:hypothetical protein n=1 Tax=Sodalis-like endosymbiont of Proechinophthirus fluctus TaxID=1462730 RepID=UPI0016509201|nr:hypothetical protein [Sodalis-like endosymbiont of Proechinophthirus fluctus]